MADIIPADAPAPEAEFQRGDPTEGPASQPLQKGDAKQLNEGLALAHQAPAGVDLSGARSVGPPQVQAGGDERKQFLLGPTQDPFGHVGKVPVNARPDPKDVQAWVPSLLAAAQDPTAPPELHTLLMQISNGLEAD